MHRVLSLVVALAIPQAAGGIGALFTRQSVSTWYRQVDKPGFTPPSWLFGPVWTTLYLLMGLASWLVWRQGREARRSALPLYGLQLGLNTLWSGIFFGLRAPGAALAEIVVLWGLILATALRFARYSRPAGLLLLPYLAWTTFAMVLNASVWLKNR